MSEGSTLSFMGLFTLALVFTVLAVMWLDARVTKLEHMQDCVIAQGVNCQ